LCVQHFIAIIPFLNVHFIRKETVYFLHWLSANSSQQLKNVRTKTVRHHPITFQKAVRVLGTLKSPLRWYHRKKTVCLYARIPNVVLFARTLTGITRVG